MVMMTLLIKSSMSELKYKKNLSYTMMCVIRDNKSMKSCTQYCICLNYRKKQSKTNKHADDRCTLKLCNKKFSTYTIYF